MTLSTGTEHMSTDEFVNAMVKALTERGLPKPCVDTVDLIFRPYLHWLKKAHTTNINSDMARESIVQLLNMMILELSTRIAARDDNEELRLTDWITQFLNDLHKELSISLADAFRVMNDDIHHTKGNA
jgi:hypothetical protein